MAEPGQRFGLESHQRQNHRRQTEWERRMGAQKLAGRIIKDLETDAEQRDESDSLNAPLVGKWVRWGVRFFAAFFASRAAVLANASKRRWQSLPSATKAPRGAFWLA